jgi:hypothetical protein
MADPEDSDRGGTAMTRVCLYTRISTDEENQPTSLHTQREGLEAFCAVQEGWRIVAHHEDRASGAKLDRPGLKAALDLTREDRIDLLLVYRVDRLSRNVRQLAQLTEELDKLDVVLRSATEPFDTGSAYLGRVIWRGESLPGLDEPLIDELTFARAQRLLRERGDDMALRRSSPGDYLFTGLLRCGRCRRAYVGVSARGNGGLYHYYACSGRQKLGPKGCDGERIPRDKLEAAVVHQLTSLYRDGTALGHALEEAIAKQDDDRPALEEQRRALAEETRRSERALDRYYTAFETGELDTKRFEARVGAIEARLDALREQDHVLAEQIAAQMLPTADTADLAAVADRLEDVVGVGDLKQAKALLRLLIKDLRVNGRKEILPTYRVVADAVCALPSSVERTGIEPVTSGLQSRRSPS